MQIINYLLRFIFKQIIFNLSPFNKIFQNDHKDEMMSVNLE